MRATILSCMLALVIFFPGISMGHGIEGAHSEGYIIDVIVIDLECEENETCVSRPSNIVEYFGADWCAECPEVEQILKDAPNESEIIISHRPSKPQPGENDFWLPASRERFLETYGLWGYPSIALDGHYFLAGPTQSRELNSLISESESNYSSITNVSLINNTLELDGEFNNLTVDIWTVSSNDNLTNMATAHTNYSDSNIVDLDGEKLIIVVSAPGYIALVSGSSMPANDYIPDGGLDNLGESEGPVKGSTVIIITTLLLIISLPATFQLIQLIRTKPANEEE